MNVQGTNVAPALAQIAVKAAAQSDQMSAAQAGLMMDALKLSGGLVVDLLNSLEEGGAVGQNVDCYA